jgi:SAM-dependent methyltransferase
VSAERALSCPACDGPLPAAPAIRGRDRLHGIPGEFAVHVCGRCGSGRTVPYVGAERLGDLYPPSYTAFALPANPLLRLAAAALFRWRYWRALRRPPLGELSSRGPGRLLDVGSGRGDLGLVLGERGWQVTGVEPSREACDQANTRGAPTLHGTLATLSPRLDRDFDAVLFQHSLEHVTEPLDDLLLARERLRPRGLLLISLPNFGSWQARRFGSDWFHLDLPRHRSHFTMHGITRLLGRAGLMPLRTTTSTSADGLPMSIQYRCFGERRYRSGFPLYASIAVTLATSPLTALADRAAGAGDILHAVACRPPDQVSSRRMGTIRPSSRNFPRLRGLV